MPDVSFEPDILSFATCVLCQQILGTSPVTARRSFPQLITRLYRHTPHTHTLVLVQVLVLDLSDPTLLHSVWSPHFLAWTQSGPTSLRFGLVSEHFLDRTQSACNIYSVVFHINRTSHQPQKRKQLTSMLALVNILRRQTVSACMQHFQRQKVSK